VTILFTHTRGVTSYLWSCLQCEGAHEALSEDDAQKAAIAHTTLRGHETLVTATRVTTISPVFTVVQAGNDGRT
jgi:hypothetical protein